MKIENYFDSYITPVQKNLYPKLRVYSASYPLLGRAALIAASVVDGAIDIVKCPLQVIQFLAFAAINLVGAILYAPDYTLKDTIIDVLAAVTCAGLSVCGPLVTVVVLLHQTAVILRNPQKAKKLDDAVDLFNKGTACLEC